jgi:hypothetical protein
MIAVARRSEQERRPPVSTQVGRRFGCLAEVGRGGVEPPTFRFSGGRSYRLSYLPKALGAWRS